MFLQVKFKIFRNVKIKNKKSGWESGEKNGAKKERKANKHKKGENGVRMSEAKQKTDKAFVSNLE